ncbi:hypothetical protein [Stieleria marina]|uniref:hypothetical protein n=1 Tax=Stieleria marina TaxID=1930275 RepID=UPI003AF3DD6A
MRKVDMTFTFQTEDGRTIEGQKHIPDSTGDVAVGEIMPVWYSASQPEVYELAIGHQQRNTNAYRWLAVIFGSIFATYFVIMPFSKAKKLLTIRDQGKAMEATVREPARHDVQHGRGEHLHWQVEGLQPEWSFFPVPEFDRPQAGKAITVFHYKNKSVWEGEFGPKAVR